MGTSHPESRPWIISKILSNDIKTIVDVGAGSGTYYDALLETRYKGKIDAVEVWEPYVQEFQLRKKYRKTWIEDVRHFDRFHHDLAIFGDVMEHMTVGEALEVWDRASKYCAFGVISIPIIEYHQHAINGNPYEEHIKEDWSHEEVLDTFPHIVDSWQGNVVGAYWAKFR
jgi:hypothetical protein